MVAPADFTVVCRIEQRTPLLLFSAFLSNQSFSVSKPSFSPKQIVSNAARRYSKAHRDAIKRVWPPSLDARAPVQVKFILFDFAFCSELCSCVLL